MILHYHQNHTSPPSARGGSASGGNPLSYSGEGGKLINLISLSLEERGARRAG